MSIENKGFREEGIEKEYDPDEIIIFSDLNRSAQYYRGKRSFMQTLAELGGDPWEVKSPRLNEHGQIYNSVEWDDESGKPSKLNWIDVDTIPDSWKNK